MHTHISSDEIRFFKTKHSDNTGKVFEWKGRVLRGIYPEQVAFVRSLFSTGLLDDLQNKSLIPKVWITDFGLDEFGLVLEHEKIWPVVFPQEWTFSMLKDAALFVYTVGLTAKRFGFNMKDSHGFNVLFSGASPKFSDLGSFVPDECSGWLPYEQFLEFYYYPLNIWQYNSILGKLSIFAGRVTTHQGYLSYQYPFYRRLGPYWQSKAVALCVKPSIEAQTRVTKAEQASRLRSLRPRTIMRRLARRIVPIESFSAETIIAKIETMKQAYAVTSWGDYHERIAENAKRFSRIIEILNSIDDGISTAVDLGGNQGRFSRQLLHETNLAHVACIDSDELAIETGYSQEKTAKTGKITFAHFDFMERIVKLNSSLPDERYKCDVVFALALTHHLILSQNYQLDEIFKRIKSFSRRYAFIEFMPLGLWSTGQVPMVPDWYSLQWFRHSFVQHFSLLHEEMLMANRVLLVGEIREITAGN